MQKTSSSNLKASPSSQATTATTVVLLQSIKTDPFSASTPISNDAELQHAKNSNNNSTVSNTSSVETEITEIKHEFNHANNNTTTLTSLASNPLVPNMNTTYSYGPHLYQLGTHLNTADNQTAKYMSDFNMGFPAPFISQYSQPSMVNNVNDPVNQFQNTYYHMNDTTDYSNSNYYWRAPNAPDQVKQYPFEMAQNNFVLPPDNGYAAKNQVFSAANTFNHYQRSAHDFAAPNYTNLQMSAAPRPAYTALNTSASNTSPSSYIGSQSDSSPISNSFNKYSPYKPVSTGLLASTSPLSTKKASETNETNLNSAVSSSVSSCGSSVSSLSLCSNNNQNDKKATTTTSPSTSSTTSSNGVTYDWMKPTKNPTNGKTRTKDKYRVVYNEHQRVELEKEFYHTKYITIKRKSELSQLLCLSERQIKIWFQNRRAKDRKQSRKRGADGSTNNRNGHEETSSANTSQNSINDIDGDEQDSNDRIIASSCKVNEPETHYGNMLASNANTGLNYLTGSSYAAQHTTQSHFLPNFNQHHYQSQQNPQFMRAYANLQNTATNPLSMANPHF